MSDPTDEPPDDVDDEELAEMADELSTVLRELRDELRASREAREGDAVDPSATGGGGSGEMSLPEVPFDMPSATDVLAFTDEKLIPAAITVLEVNIRALELLQKGIRWTRPDRAGENAERVRSHAESVSRSTLQRLDTVLADLQDAAGEGALPDDAEASGIIGEARRLRDEIDTALGERADARQEETPVEDGPGEDVTGDEGEDGPPSPWGEQPEVDVDVEGELESIKAELGKDEDEEGRPTQDAEDAADEDAGTEGENGEGAASEGADGDGPASEGGDGGAPATEGENGDAVAGEDGVSDEDSDEDAPSGDGT